MSAASWFAAETLPRSEVLAERHLQRQGFSSFCPRFRKTRRHARRIDEVLAPVFPGYVFVRFDRDRDQWRAINGTLGIRRLVGQSPSHPQPMPTSAIEALLARCEGGIIRSIVPECVPGQQVRLMCGPFADQLALVEQLDERGRVRVLLNILGGQMSVRVPHGALAPA